MKRKVPMRAPPAGGLASDPAGDLPRTMRTAGAKNSSAELERKNFPLIVVKSRVVKSKAEMRAGLTDAQLEARKAARLAAIAKFGTGPLPINPTTGKRWRNTGRSPWSGNQSPVWPVKSDIEPVSLDGRWRSRRERAAELRERMATFSAIYNAGWLVRDAYFGSRQRSEQMMTRFVAVLLREMRNCRDPEALMFAVADTLTASRHGLPWEGN